MSKFYSLVVFLFLMALNVEAQQIKDPLNKPELWAQLKTNPADEGLWYKYFGKDLESMSAREEQNMIEWRQELLLLNSRRLSEQRRREQEAAERKRKAEEAEKLKNPYKNRTPKEIEALRTQEALILEEPDDLVELKHNLYVNFDILEERYAAEFERLGGDYQRYQEVHPDKKYSLSKWCEEQEQKIKALKQAKIRKLRLNNY